MNVNSHGHNLDTRFELQFPKIKHPPASKTRWVYLPLLAGGKVTRRSSHLEIRTLPCFPSIPSLRLCGEFFIGFFQLAIGAAIHIIINPWNMHAHVCPYAPSQRSNLMMQISHPPFSKNLLSI